MLVQTITAAVADIVLEMSNLSLVAMITKSPLGTVLNRMVVSK